MNTIESWYNFTRYYGGLVGARDCFELVCEDLLKRENPTCEVHRVKASRGDGGIDVYVSNGDLVQIYQCKFFVDAITLSRWQQIDNSFLRVLDLKDIHFNEWFLCVPKEFTKEEIKEIVNFKNKYSTKGIKITFVDGNEIISRMQAVNICEKWFSPVFQRCLYANAPQICPEYLDRVEMGKLKDIILDRKQHLLISGIGGMGKTTLAEKLFEEIKMMFDISLWMTYKGSILSSVAMAMAEKSVDDELVMRFEKQMNAKNNQRNLIFVDDVDDNYLSDKNREILERNAIVVVTSRMESISGYITYELEPFSDIECVKLFKKYYKGIISLENTAVIIELVNRFGKSTLLIELFARAANKSTKTLNDFLKSILERGISDSEIKVQNSKEKTYARIAEHLAALYSLEHISDKKKRILVNLSLSNERGVVGRFFDIIGASQEDIGDLVEFGWFKRNGDGFYMHSLIRECIKSQVEVYDGHVDKLVEFYTDRESYQDDYSIREKDMHFDIILNLLKIMEVRNVEDIYIFYNLAYLIDCFGYHDTLDDLVKGAMLELDAFEESNERARVACDIYNAVGIAYLSYDRSKSLYCFAKEKDIIDKYFPDNKKVCSSCQVNTALAYIGHDFAMANSYLEQALSVQKEIFGEVSEYVADIYHGMGSNYYSASEYSKAIAFFERARSIKAKKGICSYSLIKTEFALANSINMSLKEPFEKTKVGTVLSLYASVLEGYKTLNNIKRHEYINTINIIADFLDKIGEKEKSKILRRTIE